MAPADRADASAWGEREKTLHVAGRDIPLLVPRKGDPRLIEVGALIVALVVRVVVMHQALTAWQMLAALGTAAVLDVIGTYLRRRVLVTPASSLITGLIVALIITSSAAWPFALAAAIGIAGKHLFRIADRHVFNPSVLGLTVVLLAFPTTAHVSVQSWEASALISPVLFFGGSLAAKKAGVVDLLPWFVPTYIVCFILAAVLSHGTLIFRSPGAIADSLPKALYLAHYSFVTVETYLLPDPRTAPRTHRGRVSYAIFTGVAGVLFNVVGLERLVAIFAALLLANLLSVWVFDRQPSLSRLLLARLHGVRPGDGEARERSALPAQESVPEVPVAINLRRPS